MRFFISNLTACLALRDLGACAHDSPMTLSESTIFSAFAFFSD